MPPQGQQVWEVIGGEETGGILVRDAQALGSSAKPERLSTGALVREEELAGVRLRYTRLTGAGPDEGWVSISLKGKVLLERTQKAPPRTPAALRDESAGTGRQGAAGEGEAGTTPALDTRSGERQAAGGAASGGSPAEAAGTAEVAASPEEVDSSAEGPAGVGDGPPGAPAGLKPNFSNPLNPLLFLNAANPGSKEPGQGKPPESDEPRDESQAIKEVPEPNAGGYWLKKALGRLWGAPDSDEESGGEEEEEEEEVEIPRSRLHCVSPGCSYRVHSNSAYGSYCCTGCYESWGQEHNDRCERLRPEGAEEEDDDIKGSAIEDKPEPKPVKKFIPKEDRLREAGLSKEEEEAQDALEDAKKLAIRLDNTAKALIKEEDTGTSHEARSLRGQKDLLGQSTAGANLSSTKLALVKYLQDAANALLKDGVLEAASRLASSMQKVAVKLVKGEGGESSDEDGKKDAPKLKFAESELKEEERWTPAEWRKEVSKLRRQGDTNGMAQMMQDAATALLKDELYGDARQFARDAEGAFRELGSRWRLGVALDTLAKAHLHLLKAKGVLRSEKEEHIAKALKAATEAVDLLMKIGHPQEEQSLATARTTLAEVRDLAEGGNGKAAAPAVATQQGAAARRGEKSRKMPSSAKAWRELVAQERARLAQARAGGGDREGVAKTLQSAAAALLKDGSAEEARQLAEEAATIYRQAGAPKRLAVALDTVARAHLRLIDAQSTALDERQNALYAMTAVSEAVSILAKGKDPEWAYPLAAAQCTLLRVRAQEFNDEGSGGGGSEQRQNLEWSLKQVSLKRTFGYASGLEKPTGFAWFDARDEVCRKVGGFAHGQVVRDQDGSTYVVVGVKPSDEGRQLPQLWFQPKLLRKPASCYFAGADASTLQSLLSECGREKLTSMKPEDGDAAVDEDGAMLSLCRECMLPLGTMKYASQDGEGFVHGECMARILLDKSQTEDRNRVKHESQQKAHDRVEYNIGWRPTSMLPSNEEFFRKRQVPRPKGSTPDAVYCLALEATDPPKVRIVQTKSPESFVNLSYLVQALQVRIKAGMAPYFSLDTPNADESWQVKTFGPPWLKGTSVGEVLFQADYHLKELSMGDSLFEQPVIGMKTVWDYKWKADWRGREWFVVRNAKVYLSENNILLPHVEMGVEAREQVANDKKQLVDAKVTSNEHPLVKYADAFTHYFDLIAERKSVIYHLREVSKAAIVAKFLVDNKVALDDFWLKVQEDTSLCKLELPFNKQERYYYDILVCDGAIKEQHGGVLQSMTGLYGGVDLNIDAFDLTMPTRISKTVETPNYAAIYADPGRLGSAEELSRLSQRELRRLVQEAGGQVPAGPTDKADLVETLLRLRPQEDAPEAAAEGDGDGALEHEAAFEQDLRKLALPDETISAIVQAVRTREKGASDAAPQPEEAPEKRGFWESLGDDSSEHVATLRAVFNSRFCDRREEKGQFVPPVVKDSYMKSLEALVAEERRVQEDRRKLFFSVEFAPSQPGPLFPTSWKTTFNMHTARGTSVAAGGDTARGRQLARSSADVSHVLQERPVFDKRTDDGARFRIYRQDALEVRTVQEEEGGEEKTGAVFEVSTAAALSVLQRIVKATEFVRSADGGGWAVGDEADHGPLYAYFVCYESDLGDLVFTERRPDGRVIWEENPIDMEERLTRARLLRVADCSKVGTTLGGLKRHSQTATSSKRYAKDAFERAGGTPIVPPGIGGVLRPPDVQQHEERRMGPAGAWPQHPFQFLQRPQPKPPPPFQPWRNQQVPAKAQPAWRQQQQQQQQGRAGGPGQHGNQGRPGPPRQQPRPGFPPRPGQPWQGQQAYPGMMF